MVDFERAIALLHDAVLHHHHAVAHGARLFLVVGDIHRGATELQVQPLELGAHLDAQLGVQVRQRFVEEEALRIAYDGPADRDALALAARKLLGPLPQEVRDAQHLRRFLHLLGDDRLGHLAQPEREGHVLEHRHVRVERVALKYHGDVAILRRHVVHQLAVDAKRAGRDFFQAGDHAQRGRLAAARRPDQHDELAILDLQVEVVDRLEATLVDLLDVFQCNGCHKRRPI